MPVTNIIDAVQQKYTALTSFSGKPAELAFGDVWPSTSGGYPFIRFLHMGTDDQPADTTFEYAGLEVWKFRFEIYSQTVQQCILIHDRVKLNGSAPETAAGFRYASSVTMPDGYSFKSFEPVGDWAVEVRSGQASPTGTPIHVLTFDMALHVQRVTFS